MSKYEKRVAEIRAKVEKLKEEIEDLREGVRPLEKAKQLLLTRVDLAAAEVQASPGDLARGYGNPYRHLTNNLTLVGGAERADGAAIGLVADPAHTSFAFACRFNREGVLGFLTAELEEFYASAPTIKDPAKIEKLQTELRALLKEEEALITEAKCHGAPIARRADADVGVILGL